MEGLQELRVKEMVFFIKKYAICTYSHNSMYDKSYGKNTAVNVMWKITIIFLSEQNPLENNARHR